MIIPRTFRSPLVGLALLAVVLAAACGSPEPRHPLGAAAAPSVTAGHTPGAVPVRTTEPAPTPSASASVASTTPAARTIDWYLGRLPRFDSPPVPIPVQAAAGERSPLWYELPTSQKVAFLTIDDGAIAHPAALPLLRASGVRVTLFLTYDTVKSKRDYFLQLQAAGAVIENHTLTHASLRGLPYEAQRREICGAADKLGALFGRRPTLFRPPYGNYDDVTLKVARDCGQVAVLHWRETVNKGIVRFQSSPHIIRPGHIILMHFRPAFADDFVAALAAMKRSGVQPALLEDYIVGAS